MMNRQTPPGLTSISKIVVVKSFGPHQEPMCSGSVQAWKTRSRGASNTRVKTISRSAALVLALLAAMLLLLVFQFTQIIVQTIEALLPETAIVLRPVGDFLE